MDFICGTLFAFVIVGAYETQPGWMQVHQYNPETQEIITLGMNTDDYLECWKAQHAPIYLPGD